MRIRSIAINGGVFVITLLLMALVLEFGLRVTGIQKIFPMNPPIYQTHENSDISYILKPSISANAYGSTVTTNALGFRSPEIRNNERPIVLLGDSLIFGYGVDDDQTIGAYLQEFLPNVPVVSAGLNGYNISQLRAVYESIIEELQPRAVIVVFMPNDTDETFVLDTEGYFRPRSDTSTETYEERLHASINKPGTLPIPFKYFLQTRSALFNFFERTTKSFSFRSHAPQQDINEDTISPEAVDAYLKEFERLSARIGDLPKLYLIWPENNLHVRTRERIIPAAKNKGYVVVDLYDIYGNTYESLGWDGHPSANTNQHTAEILFNAMKDAPQFSDVISPSPTR